MTFDFDIALPSMFPTFEVNLPILINASDVECPIITEIDGGNSGNDTQFTPFNGNLDGGGV